EGDEFGGVHIAMLQAHAIAHRVCGECHRLLHRAVVDRDTEKFYALYAHRPAAVFASAQGLRGRSNLIHSRTLDYAGSSLTTQLPYSTLPRPLFLISAVG